MQVSIDESSGLERRITVAVPEDRVASEIEGRIKRLAQTTRLDGFRPGKVPRRVIEKRFGAQVREQVRADVVRATLGEALQQEQLRPAHEPAIESLEDDPAGGFSYRASFEVYPEVDLAPLSGQAIEQQQCDISDADVDAMIEKLRRQNPLLETVERPAQEGDTVVIDFTGWMDGETFAGGSGEDVSVELGAGRMLEGFESGLVGAAAGTEASLDLAFPKDYGREELAGRPVHFDVTVKAVQESRLPELDDSFFAVFGIGEGGLTAFRDAVRANMERERHNQLTQNLKGAALEAAHAAVEVELPKTLVTGEAQRLEQQARKELAARGADPMLLEQMPREGFEERAQRRVKLGIIIGEIIRSAGLQAAPDKVRQRVETQASGYADPQAVVRWYYEDPERLQEIESLVLEDEAVAWILRQATVRTAPISFDDLMNPGQTASGSEGTS